MRILRSTFSVYLRDGENTVDFHQTLSLKIGCHLLSNGQILDISQLHNL